MPLCTPSPSLRRVDSFLSTLRQRAGRRRWFLPATALCLTTLIGGCTDKTDRFYGTTKPRHGPDELWSNAGNEPEYIDPGKTSDAVGGELATNLFAGLVQFHPKTQAPLPDIAQSWTVHEGGRRYVFSLRETTWSDGVPLTAEDFVYSWRRVVDPATRAKYSSFLYPIVNAEAVNQRALRLSATDSDALERTVRASFPKDRVQRDGETTLLFGESGPDALGIALKQSAAAKLPGFAVHRVEANELGVKALSPHQLEVRLTTPIPYFLSLLAFYTMRPVPKHVVEKFKDKGADGQLWTRPKNIVSNGAYLLKEWKFRQYMWIEKNPRYWDAKNVQMKRVRLAMVENHNTTLNLYKAGELDTVGRSSLPAEFVDHLRGFEDHLSYPQLGTYFYWLNVKEPPMDNIHLRRALWMAIDRDSLTKFVTRGGQIPSPDVVPRGLAGYEGVGSKSFQPAAAKAELEQAGYSNPADVPTITLIYNTSEGHKQVAEAIQQMWKQHLGVRVEISNQEWKVYLKRLQGMDFQIARMGWIGDYADPFTFLELFSSANGNNHSNWKNAEYDALLRKANRTLDPKARLEVLREAELKLMSELPAIPIYTYARSEMLKPYVLGHFPNSQDMHPFKYMRIDERFYDGVPSTPAPNDPPAAAANPAGAVTLEKQTP